MKNVIVRGRFGETLLSNDQSVIVLSLVKWLTTQTNFNDKVLLPNSVTIMEEGAK